MKKNNSFLVKKSLKHLIIFTVTFTFLVGLINPYLLYAQDTSSTPNVSFSLGRSFNPSRIVGLNIYPDDPLKFNFIIDKGDSKLNGEVFKKECDKLVKYFLTALTVSEKEMWVNLSPYEKNRIIPGDFGKTEMGRDMLIQDYMLKQISSSLMSPSNELGKAFWTKIYTKMEKEFNTIDLPVNTFNKVWIVPQEAKIYEHEKGAFIVRNHLKVMLDEDYLALKINQNRTDHGLGNVTPKDLKGLNGLSKKIMTDTLIPEIEKEVNEGPIFANLRQIYNAVILASWYKQELKESLLGKGYVNQNKTNGLEAANTQTVENVYEQYVEAFKRGAFNFITEEYDPLKQEILPKHYFSGGVTVEDLAGLVGEEKIVANKISSDQRQEVIDAAKSIKDAVETVYQLNDQDDNASPASTKLILENIAEIKNTLDILLKERMLVLTTGTGEFNMSLEDITKKYYEIVEQGALSWEKIGGKEANENFVLLQNLTLDNQELNKRISVFYKEPQKLKDIQTFIINKYNFNSVVLTPLLPNSLNDSMGIQITDLSKKLNHALELFKNDTTSQSIIPKKDGAMLTPMVLNGGVVRQVSQVSYVASKTSRVDAQIPEAVKKNASDAKGNIKVVNIKPWTIYEVEFNGDTLKQFINFVKTDQERFLRHRDAWLAMSIDQRKSLTDNKQYKNLSDPNWQGPPRVLLVPAEEYENLWPSVYTNQEGFVFGDNSFALVGNTNRTAYENNNTQLLNEITDDQYIRISAASLVRLTVTIEGKKYYALQGKEKQLQKNGVAQYQPFGGHALFTQKFLDELAPQFEMIPEKADDPKEMAFYMPKRHLQKFMEIYDGERSTGQWNYFVPAEDVLRAEMMEELSGKKADGTLVKDGIQILPLDTFEQKNNFSVGDILHDGISLENLYQQYRNVMLSQITNADLQLIDAAFALVQKYHSTEIRDDGRIYAYHPVEIMGYLVTRLKIFDRDTLIASLLHDIPEDTPITLTQVTDQFGQTVADIVDDLTERGQLRKEKGRLFAKLEHLNRVESNKREPSIIVKVVDRLHNLATNESPNNQKQRWMEIPELDRWDTFLNNPAIPERLRNDIRPFLERERHTLEAIIKKNSEDFASNPDTADKAEINLRNEVKDFFQFEVRILGDVRKGDPVVEFDLYNFIENNITFERMSDMRIGMLINHCLWRVFQEPNVRRIAMKMTNNVNPLAQIIFITVLRRFVSEDSNIKKFLKEVKTNTAGTFPGSAVQKAADALSKDYEPKPVISQEDDLISLGLENDEAATLEKPTEDLAKGGIDLNPVVASLEIEHKGAGLKMNISDQAMLVNLPIINGLVPVFIETKKIKDLAVFIGLVP